MTVGCKTNATTSSNQNQQSSASQSSSLYKESKNCTSIILNSVNKNQQLNTSESNQINAYIKKWDSAIYQDNNDYKWKIICCVKAAKSDLDAYFDVLNNKGKYIDIAKQNHETYDDILALQKSVVISWCNNCSEIIKNNGK